jgi:hypothetical protein
MNESIIGLKQSAEMYLHHGTSEENDQSSVEQHFDLDGVLQFLGDAGLHTIKKKQIEIAGTTTRKKS